MHPVPAKRPLIVWDVVLSVAALVVGIVLVALGAFAGVFSLAFLDYCPPATCSSGGAFASVASGIAAAAVVGTIGLVVTIVRVTRRRIAWPFAVGALLLAAVALAAGAAAYLNAVGW